MILVLYIWVKSISNVLLSFLAHDDFFLCRFIFPCMYFFYRLLLLFLYCVTIQTLEIKFQYQCYKWMQKEDDTRWQQPVADSIDFLPFFVFSFVFFYVLWHFSHETSVFQMFFWSKTHFLTKNWEIFIAHANSKGFWYTNDDT